MKEFTKYSFRTTSVDWLIKLVAILIFVSTSLACQKAADSKAIGKRNPAIESPSPSPTPTKEMKSMSQDYIAALKNHDRTILDKTSQAPKELAKEIDKVISSFDEEARKLAVEFVAQQDSKYAVTFLLRRMNDSSPDVAMLAVESMGSISNKATTDEIIGEIPKVKDPFIRGKLFMDIGERTQEEGVLQKLRPAVESEEDDEAALQGLAALVKLGGNNELAEFVGIIGKTEPDDVLQIQDLMLYTAKADVARGLISWLSNDEDIVRLGSDRDDKMAKMKDMAVWIAHLLKISLPFETTHLRNFDDDEIKATGKKLQLLGK